MELFVKIELSQPSMIALATHKMLAEDGDVFVIKDDKAITVNGLTTFMALLVADRIVNGTATDEQKTATAISVLNGLAKLAAKEKLKEQIGKQ